MASSIELGTVSQISSEDHRAMHTLIRSAMYPQHLIDQISLAERRVWLQTMNLENDHMAGLIFHALKLASEKGLDVRLNVDGFSEMVTDGNLDIIPTFFRKQGDYKRFRKTSKRQLLQDLSHTKVNVSTTNWPVSVVRHLFPPVGRNHIKLAVIDDAGYLGGVNLSDKDFQREDSMLKIVDASLVRGIADTFLVSSSCGHHSSRIIASTSEEQLIFDGEETSSSLILDKAEEMLLSASNTATICTQFAPDIFLIQLLQKIQKRSLNVKLVVSDPRYISERNAWLFDRLDRVKARFAGVRMFLFPGWLHAKIIATDIGTTEARGLYGTHNFVLKGSKWGNEELALYTENPELLVLLGGYLDEILTVSK